MSFPNPEPPNLSARERQNNLLDKAANGWAFDTKADAEAWSGVSPMPDSVTLLGKISVGDGGGGLYVKGANSIDTINVAGESYGRVSDVGLDRLTGKVVDTFGPAFYQNRYKKRIVANIPSKPATYDAALALTTADYLIAQGMCLDEVDGRLYIQMCRPGTGNRMWVFVYDWSTFELINTFGLALTGVTGGEGIEVIHSGGDKYLYARTATNAVQRFDITTDPAELSILTANATYTNGAGGQISYRKGEWLIRQWAVTMGNYVHSDQFHLLDSDLTTVKAVKTFDPFDVGIDTDLADSVYIPKIQGMVLGDGYMFAPMGGAKSSFTTPDLGYGYCGLRVFGMDTKPVADNLVDPVAFAQRLISMGHYCTRMEYEGAFQHSNGKVYSLAVVVSPGAAEAETSGMIIFEEFASGSDAIDFRDCAKTLHVPDRYRITSGILPNSPNGTLRNPVTGAVLTSWDEIMTMMQQFSLPRISYWSSRSTGITDIDGVAMPASALVEVLNANNDTFVVTVFLNGAIRYYRVYGSAGSRTQLTYTLGVTGQFGLSSAQAIAGHTWYLSNGSHIDVSTLDSNGTLTLSNSNAVRGDTVEIKRRGGAGALAVKNNAGSTIMTLSANQIGKAIVGGGGDWYYWSVVGVV